MPNISSDYAKNRTMKSKKARRFINDRLSIGSLTFIAADVEYCVTSAEQEAEERIREKAHKIIKEMMGGIFQGDMPRKIADEFIQKLNDDEND